LGRVSQGIAYTPPERGVAHFSAEAGRGTARGAGAEVTRGRGAGAVIRAAITTGRAGGGNRLRPS
jgi:hypothetical protein